MTPEERAAILARHYFDSATPRCAYDGQKWPCDAYRLGHDVDEERLARAMAVVFPISFRGEFASDNPSRRLLTRYAAAIAAAYREQVR